MCIRDRATPILSVAAFQLTTMLLLPTEVTVRLVGAVGASLSVNVVPKASLPVSYTHLDVYKRQTPNGCRVFLLIYFPEVPGTFISGILYSMTCVIIRSRCFDSIFDADFRSP